MGVGGQRHAPAALLPREEARYPLHWRLGGPQGRSERVRKISPPPGFDLARVYFSQRDYVSIWGRRQRILVSNSGTKDGQSIPVCS